MNTRILLIMCVLGLNGVFSVSAMQKPAPKAEDKRPKAQAKPEDDSREERRFKKYLLRLAKLPQAERDAAFTALDKLLTNVERMEEIS